MGPRLETALNVALRHAVLVLPLLAACRTTVDFESPAPAVVLANEPLPVTLSNELRRLRIKGQGAGVKSAYRIGNLLSPLFDSRDGRAFLNLVEASVEQERDGEGWSARFHLVLALQREGQTETVGIDERASSFISATEAGRLAVESGIEEVYASVRRRLAAR